MPAGNSHTICRLPTDSLLQQRMREGYATSPRGAQRELLQQSPLGLGRQEQAIGRELNG